MYRLTNSNFLPQPWWGKCSRYNCETSSLLTNSHTWLCKVLQRPAWRILVPTFFQKTWYCSAFTSSRTSKKKCPLYRGRTCCWFIIAVIIAVIHVWDYNRCLCRTFVDGSTSCTSLLTPHMRMFMFQFHFIFFCNLYDRVGRSMVLVPYFGRLFHIVDV